MLDSLYNITWPIKLIKIIVVAVDVENNITLRKTIMNEKKYNLANNSIVYIVPFNILECFMLALTHSFLPIFVGSIDHINHICLA